MANFKLTQTGEQIQEDLNLLDNNSATNGQVLTADGSGGASWKTPSGGGGSGSGGLYYHRISVSITPNDPDANPENQSISVIFGLYSNNSNAFTFSTFRSYVSSLMGENLGMYGLTISGMFIDPIYNDYTYGNLVFVNSPDSETLYFYFFYVLGQQMGFTSTVFDSSSTFLDEVYRA